MHQRSLWQAAEAAGIAPTFINAAGRTQTVAASTLQKLLALQPYIAAAEESLLPAVAVFHVGQNYALSINDSGLGYWTLLCEDGTRLQGEICNTPVLTLPPWLACGYHQLTLQLPGRCSETLIIVAPQRAWQPPVLNAGASLWGACVQLYSVKSAKNWGMGDFSDLKNLLTQVAQRGGDFVGLNPLHALFPAMPQWASPYSPSSRYALNVLYIDVQSVPSFIASTAAQQWWAQDEIQQQVTRLRRSEWVDYVGVAALKITALRLAWQQFVQHGDARFDAFVQDGGEQLRQQAVFDALQVTLGKRSTNCVDWQRWPLQYRRADSEQVEQFCQLAAEEIRFWQWLQWLADQQLAACWQHGQQLGMRIGLYRDLAVGAMRSGAETWQDPTLFQQCASIGAPPDALGPNGQGWAMPPLDPQQLLRRRLQPFIALIRANMRHCGALRIDHIMGIYRLWWIPQGDSPAEGAYVAYPVAALLAVLLIESHRQRCMIIGEDLGTVPNILITQLRRCGIYSWKVLWFQQKQKNRFLQPHRWPRQAIASVSTHDLPTLRAFWQANDLLIGQRLGLYRHKWRRHQLMRLRKRQKQALSQALQKKCLPAAHHRPRVMARRMTPMVWRAIHAYLATTHCALLGLQLEDVLGMLLPVNIPGTTEAYPNWRRKLRLTIEQMFTLPDLNDLLLEITRLRAQADTNAGEGGRHDTPLA